MTSSFPPEADALYSLAPGEFTRERDALAKRLRGEGRRDEADAVKALRSPTLPAWAANQLARRHAKEVERLLEAGSEYRRTQKREALAAEREALRGLVDASREVLAEAGRRPSDSVVERVRATLQAAAAGDEAAEALRAGRLERELEPEALEALLAAGAAAAAKQPRRPRAAPKKRDDVAARRELRDAQAAAREAERAAREARHAWEEAQRRLVEAQARVAEAETRLEG